MAERLSSYQDDKHFKNMVDLLGQLITVDPVCRISCVEALDHPWIKAQEEHFLAKEVKQPQIQAPNLMNRVK